MYRCQKRKKLSGLEIFNQAISKIFQLSHNSSLAFKEAAINDGHFREVFLDR